MKIRKNDDLFFGRASIEVIGSSGDPPCRMMRP
jgi:hypothetical protein